MFDNDEIEKARERDGQPREDRPSEVDEYLAPSEEIGKDEGLPLLERDYENYPSRDDLLRPAEGDSLQALVDHPLVTSVSDIADELNVPTERVETAATLHGTPLPEGDVGENTTEDSTLTLPLGVEIDENHLREPPHEDSRLLYFLYVRCGMGVDEITETITEQRSGLRGAIEPSNTVRQALIDVGLIDGDRSSDDRRYQRVEDNDLRLGGSSMSVDDDESESRSSGGLNISTEDFA